MIIQKISTTATYSKPGVKIVFFDFNISDKTPGEIDSFNYSRIKAVLTSRISDADYLLVVVGAKTDTRDSRSSEIGARNWQIWEIEKAKKLGKKVIAVKIKPNYSIPNELYGCGAIWANSFTQQSMLNALS